MEAGSDVPQSAQKWDVSGFDKWHFGHWTVTADTLQNMAKEYQGAGEESIRLRRFFA
jgi:hypothetical protein